jgi:hypothetical protein
MGPPKRIERKRRWCTNSTIDRRPLVFRARAYPDNHPRCDAMDSSSQSKDFPTTLWTVVLHAGRDEPGQVRAALAQLCQAYWYPLYSFVRRRGYAAAPPPSLVLLSCLLSGRNRGRNRAPGSRNRPRRRSATACMSSFNGRVAKRFAGRHGAFLLVGAEFAPTRSDAFRQWSGRTRSCEPDLLASSSRHYC